LNLDDIEDDTLFKKLDESIFADIVLRSDEWKIVRLAFERAKIRQDHLFILANPKTSDEAAQIFYNHRAFLKIGYDLESFLNMLKKEGKYLFEEAKAREIISSPQTENGDSSTGR